MVVDGEIWAGTTDDGEGLFLLPQMANRHGLIAGATGTGKTVTLKVLAESFSDMGVPVFMADVKGDIAGIMNPGTDSADMQARIARFGLEERGFHYHGYPVTFWDIYGEKGIQLRTTISEMGPLLLSRILNLNDLQSSLLTIAFKIADDNDLLLIDTKDLKALLSYIAEHNKEFSEDYGNIAKASINTILRAVVALELEGGETFFGETALNITDWFTTGDGGRGMINVLDSESLINNGKLYSTFLLWLLSELFETLPEVGDLDKPKMVFFFDEAHLLFNGAPKSLLDKIEQVVKLIRSKGVGVYFCTQNPRDIPDGVLAQLGNKIEHALHAYTPAEQKAVRAAAMSFRENPDFDTYETIMGLGTGEAVVSFLNEDGTPGICKKISILPPQCAFGSISESERDRAIKSSMLYSKYAKAVDPDSAYEFLQRKGLEEAAEKEEAREQALADKEAARQAAAEEKAAQKAAEKEERDREREKQKEANAKKRAVKSVGNSVAGTVGREVGKSVGGKFGKFGKTLGGNVGASLGRGILSTLFKS
ncbi:MAG: DUF853 domain-containing protein [Lachnospiraceae bacterium]|nr:DUF853 domain-containing protein [Lachnospiraceae bacterium]